MAVKNISLIGFMGSGKTTIGKILAERTGFLFVDIDRIIEYVSGKKISNLFKDHGESYFRNLEKKTVEKLYIKNTNCVFSCGGGVFEISKNIEFIRKNSFVVFLNIDAETAYKRLQYSEDRPLLNDETNIKSKIEYLINKRNKIYMDNSDAHLNVSNKEPEYFANEILKIIDN
ncbi:MAG: shikimate kinase [Actinomycetota bacterium]|nr:shikimate kinase [Actinomycetota bacterium]